MSKKFYRKLLTILMLVISVNSRAALIQYDFTASISSMFEYNGGTTAITNVNSSLFTGTSIAIGQALSGKFSYDTSDPLNATYQPPVPATGTYQLYSLPSSNQGIQYSTDAGNILFSSLNSMNTLGSIQVANNASNFSGSDVFYIGGSADLNPQMFQDANINLFDNTGTAFTSSSIPETLALQEFTYAALSSGWLRGSDGSQMHLTADITSLTPVLIGSVPEPDTISLLVTGLCLLEVFRRRKKAIRFFEATFFKTPA